MPLVPPRRAAEIYREEMASSRRERLFLSSISFFATFGVARTVTHAIRSGRGPFRNLSLGGRHLHHLVFGIGGLIGTGYLWLLEIGTGGRNGSKDRFSTLTSLMYGSASALTLDEFALWLDLKDEYWTREGRESVDAVILFGALLSMGVWGRPFFRALLREATPRPAA